MGDAVRKIRLALSVALVFSWMSIASLTAAQTLYTGWHDEGINYEAPNGGDAYFPSVLFDRDAFGKGHDRFRMWYSDGAGGVFLVKSRDGVRWGSPAAVSGLGGDAHHAQVVYDPDCFGETPCKKGLGDKFKMWYWDMDAGLYNVGSIAHARSRDGVAWTGDQPITQDPASPLVGSQAWNAGTYGPAAVIYQPGAANAGPDPWSYSYVMYYDGTDGVREVTGLAYSADGLHWTAYAGNPVLGNLAAAAWDCSDSVYGTVSADANGFHYWYSGGGADDGLGNCADAPASQGIGYAHSADGLAWARDAGNPIFHITDGDTHRDARTYTPAVVDDGTGVWKMYYTALSSAPGDPKKIGFATLAQPAASGGSRKRRR